MASWLRAAEDLFEVVDRRAKRVVDEFSEEQIGFQSPATNGRHYQGKRTKLKAKSEESLSVSPENTDTSLVQPRTPTSNVALEKNSAAPPLYINATASDGSIIQATDEQNGTADKDDTVSSIHLSEVLPDDFKRDSDHAQIISGDVVQAVSSDSNDEVMHESTSGIGEEHPFSLHPSRCVKVVSEGSPVEAVRDVRSEDTRVPLKMDQESSQSITVDTPNGSSTQPENDNIKSEISPEQKEQREHQTDTTFIQVQEQLDEAHGLLKTAVSTGQSKEARLARVCAGLSSRLQEYKSENAQLEELLTAERELSKSYGTRINQLQKDLSTSKMDLSRAESSMLEALAAKNSEIEVLISSMDALKKQTALSEGNLASLQANMESLLRNRELTETRMMQALREELASAERRAEEERAAHNSTKMAAMEREVELEHRAVGASTALARIQRVADERTSKAAEMEQKVALLEVECASLNQELQDMEARVRRGQKKSPEEAHQVIQIQAWHEELECARQGQRDAESKLSSMEVELQKMRVEIAAMRRDAEHYSRQEHMELEKRYRELTDLLYYKQTQLETMASEKAAAEFQLEKEMTRLKEAQVEAERRKIPRRASSSWEEDSDIKALEPLPLHHRHMAAASIQLQKAAKLLDSGAVRATRFLWRYPTARVILLFYLVFVHLFLMYLLHRLQERADNLAAIEIAESMGLSSPALP